MDIMHTEHQFTIELAGSTFFVETDNGTRAESQGLLRIQCVDDDFTICARSGYCNPFVPFWKSSCASLTGAARKATLIKIARDTVASEMESIRDFLAQMLDCEEPIGPELIGFISSFAARAARAAA